MLYEYSFTYYITFPWHLLQWARGSMLFLQYTLEGAPSNLITQCEASSTYGRKLGQLYMHVTLAEVSLDLDVQFVQIFF